MRQQTGVDNKGHRWRHHHSRGGCICLFWWALPHVGGVAPPLAALPACCCTDPHMHSLGLKEAQLQRYPRIEQLQGLKTAQLLDYEEAHSPHMCIRVFDVRWWLYVICDMTTTQTKDELLRVTWQLMSETDTFVLLSCHMWPAQEWTNRTPNATNLSIPYFLVLPGSESIIAEITKYIYFSHQTVRGQQECDFTILGRKGICLSCICHRYHVSRYLVGSVSDMSYDISRVMGQSLLIVATHIWGMYIYIYIRIYIYTFVTHTF